MLAGGSGLADSVSVRMASWKVVYALRRAALASMDPVADSAQHEPQFPYTFYIMRAREMNIKEQMR
jgi:hypothetical protein